MPDGREVLRDVPADSQVAEIPEGRTQVPGESRGGHWRPGKGHRRERVEDVFEECSKIRL